MPTTWNRSSEDFHKIYSANTDAFYRVGGIAMAKELDEFMTRCALGLWSRGGRRDHPAPCRHGEPDIFPQPAAAEMDALVTDKLRV